MYSDSELYRKVAPHHSQTNCGYKTELAAYGCNSATASVFDLLWLCGQCSARMWTLFQPLLNAPGKLHSSSVLFFSLSPTTAVEIQKHTSRLCLCIKESKQVKKQRCCSLESMLVSLQTPLPEVYSGGGLRSLHYPRASPGIQPGSCSEERCSWKET